MGNALLCSILSLRFVVAEQVLQVINFGLNMEEKKTEDCATNNKIVREADWLSLPDDVLSLVADKLIDRSDYTRFGSVCNSWRSMYIGNWGHIIREPLVLMLPAKHDPQRRLYSFSQDRVYTYPVTLPYHQLCISSNHGWLATVTGNYEVRLINPFFMHNNEIVLPPLTTFKLLTKRHEVLKDVSHLRKVVLSADPVSNPNYVAVAIHGSTFKRLSYFKLGDKGWTIIGSYRKLWQNNDVIYDKDKFYAVNCSGTVYACDVNGSRPKICRVASEMENECYGKRYLVKSSTELLQVVRHCESQGGALPYHTTGFTVFRFDSIARKWNKVESLGGRMLFLGANCYSRCLSVSDMPGCKPNCIYFTYDHYDVHQLIDMGVFSLEDHCITSHYSAESGEIIPAPMIIQPPPEYFESNAYNGHYK